MVSRPGNATKAENSVQSDMGDLQALFDLNLDLLCIADTEGVFRKLNPRWEQVLGYRLDEMVGKKIFDFIHPDDIPSTMEALTDLNNQRAVFNFINRYRKNDGTYCWIEWVSFPQESKIYAAARDITERQMILEELREGEERYRSLVDSMSEGILLHDRNGVIIACNPATQQILGRSQDELLGRITASPTLPMIHEDGIEFDDEEHPSRITLQTGKAQRNVMMGIRKQQGQITWIIVNTIPLFYPGNPVPYGAISSFTDISVLKETEAKLRASEELYRRQFTDNGSVMLLINPVDGKIASANQAALDYYGYSRERFLNLKIQDIAVLSIKEGKQMLDEIVSGRQKQFQVQTRLADGRIRDVEITTSHIHYSEINFLYSIIHDVTERNQAEKALRESEENLASFFESMGDLLLVVDREAKIITTNPAARKQFGYSQDELVGAPVISLYPSDRQDEVREIWGEIFAGRQKDCFIPIQRKEDGLIPVEIHTVWGKWNGADALFAVVKDVSELKKSEEKFSKAFNTTPVMMAISRIEDEVFVDINDTFCNTMGYDRSEVLGKSASELGHFVDPAQRHEIVEKVLREGYARNIDVAVRTRKGQILQGIFSMDLIKLGEKPYLLSVMQDITERKKIEEELRRMEAMMRAQAYTDALTGLLSRRRFEEIANEEISRSQRHAHPLAMIMLDIDFFKEYNDHYGHPAGDEALVALAKIIRESVRLEDQVGRIGGEEFTILLPEMDLDGGKAAAERIRKKIEAGAIYLSDGSLTRITCSFGVTALSERLDSYDKLYRAADFAMYRAKQAGRNRTMVEG